jgi:hypothetical protein
MFYKIEDFSFLIEICKQLKSIQAEFEAQRHNPILRDFYFDKNPVIHSHTEYWIKEGGFDADTVGYDSRIGTFGSLPLYKTGFPIKWFDVHSLFPSIIQHIIDVPNVNFAAFSRLGPNSGLDEHVHAQSNLIFHLCLTDTEGHSVLRCNGEERILSKPGDYALFDYSLPHSSFNYGKADRVNLAIDFSR